MCYLREGISKENSEAAGTSGKKVVSRKLPTLEPDLYLII
jgi:hypothetical protein